MKRITTILLLFFISLVAASQLSSLVVKNDTLFSFNPSTGVYTQLTKWAPAASGQTGKVMGSNGSLFSWMDLKTVNGTSLIGAGNVTTDWNDLQNKPSTFAPSGHNHPIGEVTDLQTTIDGKLSANGNGGSLTGLTKSQVGLSNADNTSDANKPVSSATQTALNNKSTFYFGLDAGANDSYSITASPVPASYTQGMMVVFRANTANTTGCSINVNGLGAKTIVKRVSTTPATGDILSLMFCWLVYDGTNFVILNPVVN